MTNLRSIKRVTIQFKAGDCIVAIYYKYVRDHVVGTAYVLTLSRFSYRRFPIETDESTLWYPTKEIIEL